MTEQQRTRLSLAIAGKLKASGWKYGMDPIPFLENCAGMNERFRDVAYDVAYGKPCPQCGSRDGTGVINDTMETTFPCPSCTNKVRMI